MRMKCKACNKEITTSDITCDVCGWPDIKKVIEYFDRDGMRENLDMRYRLLKYFVNRGWIEFTAKLEKHGWTGIPPDRSFVPEANMGSGIGMWWFDDEVGNQVYILWNTITLTPAQALHLGMNKNVQFRGVYTNPYDMFRDIEEIEEENRENRLDAIVHWERRLINHPYGASMYGERIK